MRLQTVVKSPIARSTAVRPRLARTDLIYSSDCEERERERETSESCLLCMITESFSVRLLRLIDNARSSRSLFLFLLVYRFAITPVFLSSLRPDDALRFPSAWQISLSLSPGLLSLLRNSRTSVKLAPAINLFNYAVDGQNAALS